MRARGERAQVAERQLAIDVESELGELDRRLAGQAGLLSNAIDALEVVPRHRFRFREVGDVFAQPREDGADAFGRHRPRGDEHVVERLARHELGHGAPHERRLGAVLAQPLAVGGFQEEGAANAHAASHRLAD